MQGLIEFWQNHFMVFNIVLPAITAYILILIGDNPKKLDDHFSLNMPTQPIGKRLLLRRIVSLGSASLGLVLALLMLNQADSGQIFYYQLSEWTAPFGIVLVVDRLSAMMVVLTSVLFLPILYYASHYWDTQGRYFHAMTHFLLMGVNGAFLTGDLFNLFVFFEILLLSSYVLFLHGHDKSRFVLGTQYVILNLLASAIFLIGLGLIYANVGSLNMADVARLLPTLTPQQHQLAMAGGLLLFVVFAIKASVIPVGLPRTYATAAAPIAAMFTILTKVGLYAILRVQGTIFSDEQGILFLQNWLLFIGIFTSLLGVISAGGTDYFRRTIGFLMISSIGTILIGISLFSVKAWSATLYYMVHSTVIVAGFYLFAEWLVAQRGTDVLRVADAVPQQKLLSIVFLIMALTIAGLPPFSGFWGKVMLLQAISGHNGQIGIMVVVLFVSLLSIIVLVRNGFILFWRSPKVEQPQQIYTRPQRQLASVIGFFVIALICYVVFAEKVVLYTQATATQLMDKTLYQRTILKTDEQGKVISVQPYEPNYVPYTNDAPARTDKYQSTVPYTISPNTLDKQQGEHK